MQECTYTSKLMKANQFTEHIFISQMDDSKLTSF